MAALYIRRNKKILMCSGTSSKTLNIDELKAGKAGSKVTGPLLFSCLFIYYYYFYGDWQPALKDN